MTTVPAVPIRRFRLPWAEVWLCLLFLFQVSHAEPSQINVRVVSVADGDTLTILDPANNAQHKIGRRILPTARTRLCSATRLTATGARSSLSERLGRGFGGQFMDARVTISQDEFLLAIERFKTRSKVKPKQTTVLGFDGRFFSIEALGVVAATHAEGSRPGVATFPSSYIVVSAKAPLRREKPNG